MGREFELKYRATPEQLTEIQRTFGPFREITMETTYYDTLDHRLSQRRWTLRRRMENGTSVCTLKIPLPDGSRGEWEAAQENLMAAIPELCHLGAPAELKELVQSGITETCGAKFTRLAATLSYMGSTLELALDQGALLGGGKKLPFCEAEVELKAGREEDAMAFAAHLAQAHGLIPEHDSKQKRAMALTKKEK
ncbi:MAG: inorganic triphosphatase [Faecousia sp.]